MGEYNNGEEKSEWNEQQLFSSIWFQIHAACRIAQIGGNYQEWKNSLQAKISHVFGICSDDKVAQERLNQIRTEIDQASIIFNKNRFSVHIKDAYQRDMVAKGKFGNVLENALFKAESEIDCITNKKMPFLKMKEKFDYDNISL